MSVLRPLDVARRWQCSERHVRNVLSIDPKPGQLRGFKAGGKLWRTRSEWVEEYERCQSGGWEDTETSGRRSAGTDQTGPVVRLERIVERQNG